MRYMYLDDFAVTCIQLSCYVSRYSICKVVKMYMQQRHPLDFF